MFPPRRECPILQVKHPHNQIDPPFRSTAYLDNFRKNFSEFLIVKTDPCTEGKKKSHSGLNQRISRNFSIPPSCHYLSIVRFLWECGARVAAGAGRALSNPRHWVLQGVSSVQPSPELMDYFRFSRLIPHVTCWWVRMVCQIAAFKKPLSQTKKKD